MNKKTYTRKNKKIKNKYCPTCGSLMDTDILRLPKVINGKDKNYQIIYSCNSRKCPQKDIYVYVESNIFPMVWYEREEKCIKLLPLWAKQVLGKTLF